jgi:Tol biopolymer transport system component
MKHLLKWLTAFALCAAALPAAPAQAKVPGPNGQIVFQRIDRKLGGTTIYTMNPDGSHVQQLFARGAEFPHWSPDGRKVSIFCCDDGMAAHIVDADTGSFRELAPPDPTLEVHCGLWSPDARRFACESYGITDPGRNGIYSIRTSDGGGLKRITTNAGGADTPVDYSPDGKRLVFVRQDPTGRVGLFVTALDGSGLLELPTPGLILEFGFFAGSWSPSGNKILFVARTAPDHRRAIWVVNADGSGLHQLPITPSCGGAFSDPKSISCFDPGWSPDGTKIVFTGVSASGPQSIYTVKADGSGLVQVTHGLTDGLPDWGRTR